MSKVKLFFRKLEEDMGGFTCPSCGKRRWLAPIKRTYFSPRLNQSIESNIPHCYVCKKVMKNLLLKM